MKNKTIYAAVTILAMVLLPQLAIAQGAPPATPIDGGLSLLLAGAAAYGVKKIRDSRSSD